MLDQVDNSGLDKILAKRQAGKSVEPPKEEMTFLEHLEELRWHLMRSVIAVLVLAIVAFVSKKIVFGIIILGPSRTDFITFQWLCQLSEMLNTDVLCLTEMPFTIQSRQMTGQFVMHMTSSFVLGLVVAFPYIFWEMWSFIKPALYTAEQKVAKGTTFFVSVLFFMGIAFGYFIIAPLSINFLGSYTVDDSKIGRAHV